MPERPTRRALLGAAIGLAVARPASATPALVAPGGVALGGYDTVAYWSVQTLKGEPSQSFAWNGARWLFATPANRAAFAADPARYAPAFNGYCVYCLANGKLVPGLGEFWVIDKSKLYLQSNAGARENFTKRVDHYVERAAAFWATLS
jgi:hypothetical protein